MSCLQPASEEDVHCHLVEIEVQCNALVIPVFASGPVRISNNNASCKLLKIRKIPYLSRNEKMFAPGTVMHVQPNAYTMSLPWIALLGPVRSKMGLLPAEQ